MIGDAKTVAGAGMMGVVVGILAALLGLAALADERFVTRREWLQHQQYIRESLGRIESAVVPRTQDQLDRQRKNPR